MIVFEQSVAVEAVPGVRPGGSLGEQGLFRAPAWPITPAMVLGQLIGLHYSPWTERARWVLEWKAVPFRYTEYVPMLGEPWLRWKARTLGSVSVPTYVDDGGVYADSSAIVRRAEEVGEGPSLTEGLSLDAWAARVEPGLQAGRALVAARTLADREALREAVMAVSPEALAGAMRPVAVLGARFIAAKYGADLADLDGHRRHLRELVVGLQDELGDRSFFVGGRFTAADVYVATLLQTIRPVAAPHLRLAPATERAWTTEDVAAEIPALLAWRDGIYAAHRVRSAA